MELDWHLSWLTWTRPTKLGLPANHKHGSLLVSTPVESVRIPSREFPRLPYLTPAVVVSSFLGVLATLDASDSLKEFLALFSARSIVVLFY